MIHSGSSERSSEVFYPTLDDVGEAISILNRKKVEKEKMNHLLLGVGITFRFKGEQTNLFH